MPKTVNLRNLPDELVRKAKSRAALQGVTLKDFVQTAIEKATEDVPFPGLIAMSMMQSETKRRTRKK
jgi:plasmid stability protein